MPDNQEDAAALLQRIAARVEHLDQLVEGTYCIIERQDVFYRFGDRAFREDR